MFRFVILLCLSLLTVIDSKEECVRISTCKCRHSKGTVNLSGLRGHIFNVSLGGMEILYFPCEQLVDIAANCMKSDNNAICTKNNSNVSVWGKQESVKFIVPNTIDYGTILAEFSFLPPGHATRRTQLYLHCPKEGDTIRTQFKVDNYQHNDMALTLTNKMACFVVRDIWGSGHLLVTELILIIVSVLGSVSVVALCRYRRGEKGFDLINHKRTFVGVCGLFIDGFRTTFFCFPKLRRNIGVKVRNGYSEIYSI